MSTAVKKQQQQSPQQSASTPAAGSGTGGSAFFRRKKMVPSVVARKLGTNTTGKASKQVASSVGEPESQTTVESAEMNAVTIATATASPIDGTSNQSQSDAETAEERSAEPTSESTRVSEELKPQQAKVEQANVSAGGTKPATAFRRIKPKVSILATHKPAKSILKKTNTPVKEKPETPANETADTLTDDSIKKKENEKDSKPPDNGSLHGTIEKQEEKISEAPHPTSQQSVVDKTVDEKSVESKQTMSELQKDPSSPSQDAVTSGAVKGDVIHGKSDHLTIDKVVKKRSVLQNITSFVGSPAIKSLTAPSPEATSTPPTVPAIESNVPENIPETVGENNAVVLPIATKPSPTATKQIKRTINLGKLLSSPSIAEMLKSSIGKSQVSKSLRTNGKITGKSKQGETKPQSIQPREVHEKKQDCVEPLNPSQVCSAPVEPSEDIVPVSSARSTIIVKPKDTPSVAKDPEPSLTPMPETHCVSNETMSVENVIVTPGPCEESLKRNIRTAPPPPESPATSQAATSSDKALNPIVTPAPCEAPPGSYIRAEPPLAESLATSQASSSRDKTFNPIDTPVPCEEPNVKVDPPPAESLATSQAAASIDKALNPIVCPVPSEEPSVRLEPPLTEPLASSQTAGSSDKAFGSKKVQKVHQLTAAQQQLILQSLKKGKVKRKVAVTNTPTTTRTEAPVKPTESATIVSEAVQPTNLIQQRLSIDTSSINTTSTVTNVAARNRDNKVNIISDLILPRIVVSTVSPSKSSGPAYHAGTNIPSAAPVAYPIISLPAPPKTQHEGNMPPSAIVSPGSSTQYPKLYILHRPGPASYTAVPSSVTPPSTVASCSYADVRPTPPSAAVSVTVLPAAARPLPSAFVPSVVQSNTLPTPVITVRPSSPKTAPSAPAPPVLPTPVVSVTISPAKQSPENSLIVPKIVIDNCDPDHDSSQSSSSSTSSSASSGKSRGNSKNQPNNRSNAGTMVPHAQKEMGCSSLTRDRLRQKALKNLNSKTPAKRCYGPQSSVRTRILHSAPACVTPSDMSKVYNVPQEVGVTTTLEAADIANVQESDGMNNNYRTVPSSNDLLTKTPVLNAADAASTPDPSCQKIVVEDHCSADSFDACDVERNIGFCGFSNSSIECTENDFTARSVSFDAVLKPNAEEPLETMGSQPEEPVHKSNEEAMPLEMETASPAEHVSNLEAESEGKIDHKEEISANMSDDNVTSRQDGLSELAEVVRSPVALNADLQKEEAFHYDPDQSVEVVKSFNCEVARVNSSEKQEEPEHSEIQNVPSMQEESVCGTSIECTGTTQCSSSVLPESSTLRDVSPSPVCRDESTTSLDHTILSSPPVETGVDVIVAMARSRQARRVLSLDLESDREDDVPPYPEPAMTVADIPTICEDIPTQQLPVPSVSNERASKKKRKRHKRKRDQFIKLLLKHVNYEALVADLVQQEKRAYGYESSSSDSTSRDNAQTTSPLQRYIRSLELEKENNDDDDDGVDDDDEVASNNEFACMDVEMAKAIVQPFLSNSGGALGSSSSESSSILETAVPATFVPENVEEKHPADVGTGISPCSNESESPVQQDSMSCDESAEAVKEEINQMPEAEGQSCDVVIQDQPSSTPEEINETTKAEEQPCDLVIQAQPCSTPEEINETKEEEEQPCDVVIQAQPCSTPEEINETKEDEDQPCDVVIQVQPCSSQASDTQDMAELKNDPPKEPPSISICDTKTGTANSDVQCPVTLLNTSPAKLENIVICDTPDNVVVESVANSEVIVPPVGTSTSTRGKATRGRKRQARRTQSAGAGHGVVAKRMRTRFHVQALTPTAEVPPFDSSDAPNNEVVSDCSSDGLSAVEQCTKSNGKSINDAATKTGVSMVDQPESICSDSGGGGGDVVMKQISHSPLRGANTKGTLLRSGRSRMRLERQLSGSSSNSSERNNSDSCGGDLSSCDETKPVKGARRRKVLRRKKRCSRRLNKEAETVTVECSVSTTAPSVTATATSSRTAKVKTHTSTVASKLSKDSNPDTQYVISEVDPSEEADVGTTPRLLEVVNVRNHRVLQTTPMSTARKTRSSGFDLATDNPPAQTDDALKRGRRRTPKGAKKDDTVQPMVPMIAQQEEQILNESSSTTLHAAEDDDTMVKCGNCGEEVLSSVWESHAYKHNGVAFRVGIDAPFDLKDIKALSTVIMRFMKIYRRTEVTCERCGTITKSYLGMASHLTSCGLDSDELEKSKVSCEHCGRKMKAVSLGVHQQQHCKVLKQKELELRQEQQRKKGGSSDDSASKELSASGRKKRKSVANAEQKIKKLAKEVTTDMATAELVLMVSSSEVTNAIMRCWLSHLHQSNERMCEETGCPFVGLSAGFIRARYGLTDASAKPKPVYQCAKCPRMATDRTVLYAHLREAHPESVKNHQYMAAGGGDGGGGSENDSDAYVVDANSTSDDSFSSSAFDDAEDETMGMGMKKKGKGKGTTVSAKPRKSAESGKTAGGKKAATGKSAAGQQEAHDERKEEETEVYKEMVLQESIDLKQDRNNFHLLAVKWMLEFRREHFANRVLFADLRPNIKSPFYQLLAAEHAVKYLPRITHSIRFLQSNSGMYDPPYKADSFTDRWSQLGTFQGEAVGCESVFFCGGPVFSLDWLPLADGVGAEDSDQYLAVACRQTFDEYYNCEDLATPHPRKCLVQIWNVGPIQNAAVAMKFPTRCPKLAFAIACDYGPIFQVAFCPSGCYNDPAHGDDFERLGLLAVAGSDGDVHLYALSRSMAGDPNQPDSSTAAPRVVTLRPVTLLALTFASTTNARDGPASDFTRRSVVKLAWSRQKGHCVLAAGYSNGVVAVWNLNATSGLLCGTKNGIRTLLPVHKLLHSSSGCITALDLHYGFESRFLVVCNADRRMKVYDLRCGQYQPLETCSMVTRSRVTSMRWLLHFPVMVYSFDDGFCIDRCAYSVHQPRDIGLRNYSIFTIGCETTDIGVNDWYSISVIATRGGDLVSHRPIPFVNGMNYKKLTQILTTTIPLKLDASADSDDISLYNRYSETYGLVFSDTDKVPTAMDSAALKLKSWRRGKLSHYPAERLNQIRWNPNSSSYTYYAIGYQAGFVRIRLYRM